MQDDSLADVANMLLSASVEILPSPELYKVLEAMGLKTEALPSRVRGLFFKIIYVLDKLLDKPDDSARLILACRASYLSVLATSKVYEEERR